MSDKRYRAVVIGGGVVGCNILFQLTKAGWSDVALCERHQLTAGATWHSSGHISALTPSKDLSRLAMTTRRMLKPLEAESGQALGLVESGSLRLATSSEQLREFEAIASQFAGVGLDAQILDTGEASALWPMMEAQQVEGALYLPHDCYLNAADFTQALASAARTRGATVMQGNGIESIRQLATGEWQLRGSQQDVIAEHVISATGIFARRSPLSSYVTLPCAVITHQYLVTDTVDEVRQRRQQGHSRLPILRQPDISLNVREEGEGLFVSVYEPHAQASFVDGVPNDFEMQLLPGYFEGVEPQFEAAIKRVPALGRAGIKSMVNGPMPWSPDFFPAIGPVAELPNVWMAEAVCYGVTWSGGVAEVLARWITTGDPGCDVSALDCGRFDTHMDTGSLDAQATAAYLGSYNPETKRRNDV